MGHTNDHPTEVGEWSQPERTPHICLFFQFVSELIRQSAQLLNSSVGSSSVCDQLGMIDTCLLKDVYLRY